MARLLVVALLIVFLSACSLPREASPPPSPHCRSGSPLAGVYHPSRLEVKSRCVVAAGVVERVKFEEYDGDVHIDLRLDEAYRGLLSEGNAQVDGNLVVEIIPQDRSRVPVPEVGARIAVAGPWVDDRHHDWHEIHPARWISAGEIRPATPSELRRAHLLLAGGREGEEPD
ncbi:MAG: hypothetical protein M3M94_04410 [Actinomycetota bacterium]|nr:hypothetical protein [Actinomycetota bacterium]